MSVHSTHTSENITIIHLVRSELTIGSLLFTIKFTHSGQQQQMNYTHYTINTSIIFTHTLTHFAHEISTPAFVAENLIQFSPQSHHKRRKQELECIT